MVRIVDPTHAVIIYAYARHCDGFNLSISHQTGNNRRQYLFRYIISELYDEKIISHEWENKKKRDNVRRATVGHTLFFFNFWLQFINTKGGKKKMLYGKAQKCGKKKDDTRELMQHNVWSREK